MSEENEDYRGLIPDKCLKCGGFAEIIGDSSTWGPQIGNGIICLRESGDKCPY